MAGQSKEAPLPPWGFALAGAAGAVLANAAAYPLDIVKTRIQVQAKQVSTSVDGNADPHYESTLDAILKIVEREGVQGLYSGMNGSLIGTAAMNFAYFYWYSIIRSIYFSSKRVPIPPNTAIELSLGALAGGVAQVFTTPLGVITTRQQTQLAGENKGMVSTAKEVINGEDGWTGLWRGLQASLVLVINPSITYAAYQRLRAAMFPNQKNLKLWESFVLGAASKAIATIITQPLIVAKVGLQSKPPPARNGKQFKSFIEVMQYIIANEGPLGLYKGLMPQLTKGLLVQGLLMMIKERVELIFILLYRYLRQLRSVRLKRAADAAALQAKKVLPVVTKP
ncbi:mitochondrial carrier [Xylona heveae TC161]|uniref:Mitochondrial carrier n=1 Tax=Xylona heveae (strain CBS 132557 / TC161) TaxID=1328760 RepID=A0A165IKC1_XYLHT|nr:mitochondrial carrier [Xylona heveae TC161]KZF25016.1 mitochondrial carrier [Xylona heveae TC161]